MRFIHFFLLLFSVALLSLACGGTKETPENPTTTDTPTEAYKRLFNAVKAKNIDQIKSQMSKKTQDFAQMAAQRQSATPDKVYENGFTATTFSPSLPEIRDERKKGKWGAVEVWNSKDSTWEDLPFVIEDGVWKLAIGEQFDGTYTTPGKSRDQREKEAANVARGGAPPMNTNSMANINTNIPPDPSKNKTK